MSFEVYIPTHVRSKTSPGKASVASNGQVKIHASDLTKVGIKKECVILIDKATRRIGLRAPKEAEDGLGEPSMIVGLNKSCTTARFSITGALTIIGVALDSARRNVETMVSQEQRLITLSFGGVDGIKKTESGNTGFSRRRKQEKD